MNSRRLPQSASSRRWFPCGGGLVEGVARARGRSDDRCPRPQLGSVIGVRHPVGRLRVARDRVRARGVVATTVAMAGGAGRRRQRCSDLRTVNSPPGHRHRLGLHRLRRSGSAAWCTGGRHRPTRGQPAPLAELDREAAHGGGQPRAHRIARELHDIVAHSVSLMVVQAGTARPTRNASTGSWRRAGDDRALRSGGAHRAASPAARPALRGRA